MVPSNGASSAHERQEGHDRRADDDARIAHDDAQRAGLARDGRRFGDLGGQGLDAQ